MGVKSLENMMKKNTVSCTAKVQQDVHTESYEDGYINTIVSYVNMIMKLD